MLDFTHAPTSAASVRLNRAHPLARNLVFLAFDGFNFVDETVGVPIVSYGSTQSERVIDNGVPAMRSNNDGLGGYRFHAPSIMKLHGQPHMTLCFNGSFSAPPSTYWSCLTSPRNLTTWYAPYGSFWIGGGSGTDRPKFGTLFARGGTSYSSALTTGDHVDFDGSRISLATIKDDTAGISIHKNGALIETDIDGNFSANIDVSIPYIFLMSRNNSKAEGIAGAAAIGAVWNRTLTAKELHSFQLNPWQLFEPVSDILGAALQRQFEGGTTITGSGALTIGAAEASGSADREITGSGAPSIAQAHVAGSAERAITGAGSAIVTPVAMSGTGSIGSAITGAGAVSPGAILLAGVAEREIAGAGGLVLSPALLSGLGERLVSGAGVIAVPLAEISGIGGRAIGGSGAVAIPSFLVAGVGERKVAGSGAVSTSAALISGLAERSVLASGAVAIAPAEISGIGSVGGAIAGSGAVIVPPIQIAGAGGRVLTGAGAFQTQSITLAGLAERSILGAGAITLAVVDLSGAGAVGNVVSGSGAILIPAGEIAGIGAREILGSGAILLPAAALSGLGLRVVGGAGALTIPAILVDGYYILPGRVVYVIGDPNSGALRTSRNIGTLLSSLNQGSLYDG